MENIVIIGAGPTAVKTSEVLRELGFKGKIVMLTKEPFPPYSPPLMADYLETKGTSELIFWKGKDFHKSLDVELILEAEVGSISPEAKKITLKNGRQFEYDKLVIASGSEMWIPLKCECHKETPKEKYYNFKSLTAVTRLLDEVQKGAEKAVVIGAGFIGVEIAITLRKLGLNVTIVEMQDRILPRMVTPEISRPLEEILRRMDIELLLNSKGELLIGGETAEKLLLSNGKTINADLFIAATGVKPNISFLEGSGIQTGRGIKVNEYLQTNIPDIFAGGDVVEVPDLITGNVYPHAIYPEAQKHGQIIALNLMGYRTKYEGGLNMNSLYHFHLPLISEGAMIGEAEPDEVVIYSKNNILRKLDIKDKKILRFELIGDKKGAGLLHTLMVKRENVEDIKHKLVTGRYNQAHYSLKFSFI